MTPAAIAVATIGSYILDTEAAMARLRGRNKVAVGIPVAAMSDVAFLLIVFFIISSSFHRPSRLSIELPGDETSTPATKPPPPPRVRLTKDKLFLNDYAVEIWQLSADLRALLAGRTAAEQRVVVLSAEDAVPMERVVDVIDAVRSADAQVGHVNLEEK